MSIIDTLVTNRTGGYYGAEDLNRVGNAMYYIAERLRSFGYAITVNPRTNWTETDKVTVSEANLYLDNLRKLRAAFSMLPTTPNAPGGEKPFDVQEANDIEKILQDVEWLLNRMPFAFRHSGTFSAGQGGLIT